MATNAGNTTLAAVTVTDPGVTGLSCTPANGSALAPGASMSCTATHTVTQADLDAGHYANTACVDDGAGGAAQQCATKDVPAVQAPTLSITKAATETSFNAVGQVLHYTIVATNAGNTTLAAVTVTDPGVTGLACTPANGSSLGAGRVDELHGDAHGDAGRPRRGPLREPRPVSMTARAGRRSSAPRKDVPAVQAPALSITKAATESSFNAVGQTIHYTIVATNVGQHDAGSGDGDRPGRDRACRVRRRTGRRLAPGASMTLHGDAHGDAGRPRRGPLREHGLCR